MPSIIMGDDRKPEFEYVAGAIYSHRSQENHKVYYYLCVKNDFDTNTRNNYSFICINNSTSHPSTPAMTLVDCLKHMAPRRGAKVGEPLPAEGNLTMVAKLSSINWE